MTYATVADVKANMGTRDLALLTDRDGTPDTPNDTAIQSALDDAIAVVNGWILKRVTLPLANPPRMLTVVTRDLAIHRLYVNAQASVPEAVDKMREAAMSWLKAVANGEVSLGDETPGDSVTSSPGAVVDSGEDPVFTRESLKGF